MGEWMYSSTRSLNSALDGGDWSASGPSFTSRERAPNYPLDRKLGGLQSHPRRELNPRTPIVQPRSPALHLPDTL